MKRLLILAAVLEAATGLALLIAPSFVARLLLGDGVSGAGTAVGRVAGCALLALGIACWPEKVCARGAQRGMLTYGLLITLFLAFLGVQGEGNGPLLWPAVVLHGTLTGLLMRACFAAQRDGHNGSVRGLP